MTEFWRKMLVLLTVGFAIGLYLGATGVAPQKAVVILLCMCVVGAILGGKWGREAQERQERERQKQLAETE